MRLSIQDILAASLAESFDLVTELVVTNRGVHDLGDVELLANLQHLNCAFNAIKSLKALEKLAKLVSINMMHNQVKALTSLAQCTALQVLKVSNNGIRSLAPLAACSQLEELWVQQNAVDSLDELQHLSKLPRCTRLGFHPNPCTKDMAPHMYRAAVLAHLPTLQWLDGKPVTIEEQAAASLAAASLAARSRPSLATASSPSSSTGPGSPSFGPGSPSSLPGSPSLGCKEGGSKGGSPVGRSGASGLSRSRLVANRMGRSKSNSFPNTSIGGGSPVSGSPGKSGFHRLASLAPESSSFHPAATGASDQYVDATNGDAGRGGSNGGAAEEAGLEGFAPRSAPVHGRRSVTGGGTLLDTEDDAASSPNRSSSALSIGRGTSFLSTIMDMLPTFATSSPSPSDGSPQAGPDPGGKVAAAGRRGSNGGALAAARPRLTQTGSSGANGSGAPPGEYVCKYEAGGGKGLAAVTVRADGSATAKWPNNALAVSINREVRAGVAGYRLLACFRGSGSLAFSYTADTGSATQFTREGGIAADMKLAGGAGGGASQGADPPLDILVDTHFGFRFIPASRTVLVYFCCADVQHVFVQGFNEPRRVWECSTSSKAAANGPAASLFPDASRNGSGAPEGLSTGLHANAGPELGGSDLHGVENGSRDDQGGAGMVSEASTRSVSSVRRASALSLLRHDICINSAQGLEGDPAGDPPPAFLSKLLQMGGGAEGRSKRGDVVGDKEGVGTGLPPRTLEERLGDIRSVTSVLDALDKDLNSWLKGKLK
eukprot:jgi/Mesvir1/20504/Mv12389-RA.2